MGTLYEKICLHTGDILLKTGNDADSIYLIIDGKLDVYSSYGRFCMEQDSIACIADCCYGIGIFTYVAATDTILEKYRYSKSSDIIPLCTEHAEKLGHLVTVNTGFIMQMIKSHLSLTLKCRQKDNTYSPDSRVGKWELDKYNGMNSVPSDLFEKYHQANTSVATAAIIDGSKFMTRLNDVCLQMADFLGINMEYVAPEKTEESDYPAADVLTAGKDEYSTDEVKRILSGSLSQIVSYSGLDEEENEEFTLLMKQFCSSPNKLSTDDDFRQLRHKLTKYFYRLYLGVFSRSLYDEFIPDAVLMFLNFGFIDEHLISEESMTTLYNLLHLIDDACCSEHVFTMYSWLKHIAWGEREPSRNSLDQNYADYVKEQSRLGKMDAKEALSDNDMKVRFEIENMFTQSQRMVFGRASSYVPFLIQENVQRPLDSVILTSDIIMREINAIRSVDFSAFYRSGFYTNEKLGIAREFVYREYLPDVILAPCTGTYGAMWQEIDGRDRNTPARFILPLFCNGRIQTILANATGRFRWEICKRIQGVYWNDITEKSLTSEYCDYLQFYKKNHDLSDSAKEKIKTGLINCRNSFSEFFAREYDTWISYESSGSSRLNKVSRSITLKYCPFSKKIRDSLKENPAYSRGIELYDNKCMISQKRLDKVVMLLNKGGVPVPEDIENTIEFFRK